MFLNLLCSVNKRSKSIALDAGTHTSHDAPPPPPTPRDGKKSPRGYVIRYLVGSPCEKSKVERRSGNNFNYTCESLTPPAPPLAPPPPRCSHLHTLTDSLACARVCVHAHVHVQCSASCSAARDRVARTQAEARRHAPFQCTAQTAGGRRDGRRAQIPPHAAGVRCEPGMERRDEELRR